MDHFHKLKRQVRSFFFVVLALCTTSVVVGGWLVRQVFPGRDTLVSALMLLIGIVLCWTLSHVLTTYALTPLSLIWRAVLHVSPGRSGTAPPNLNKNTIGHELVTSLALQVYQLASTTGNSENVSSDKISLLAQSIADNIPLPIYVMDNRQTILFANAAGLEYVDRQTEAVIGKNCYEVLDFSFSSSDTFDSWLKDCRANKVTDTATWQHARLMLADQQALRQFDLAAHYSKDNSAGIETIVALFDKSELYASDDESLGFVALAVHELRTPLTMLRGYIEVFEDELGDSLTPELQSFMHKMNASAQQLTSFVSNILNVARIEENQLTLKLTEGVWSDIIGGAVADLNLRAQVHGKKITYTVDSTVPKVAIDEVSIYEVLSNLVENAIKYSGKSDAITIRSFINQEGMVETAVEDKGIGIPTSVIPHLFEKFKRNHRTRAMVGGTGLGLYLCKSIINAHGGHIWVDSNEGEGSTFSFTLKPYSMLADELKNSNNKDIVRGAHGWIKNHSLYRR